MGIGLVVLAAAFAAAVAVALSRPPRRPAPGALWLGALTIVLQGAHVLEEHSARLYERLPALVELDPWSPGLFAAFNLFWIAVWSVSLALLRRAPRPAGALLWFLAIAAIANGLAHPALAVATSGYFPGTLSAPLLGIAGLLLARGLLRAASADGGTRRHDEGHPWGTA